MPARSALPVILGLWLVHQACAGPTTHIILGGDDDPAEPLLLMPSQVEEGPDGNLYVLDTGDGTIKVYTLEGDFLRSLGGEGEGPGEFQRTDGATFGFTPDGRLFFTEYYRGHRWLTLLQLDGTLDRTLSPQLDTIFCIGAAAALPDGRFLVELNLDSEVRPEGEVYLYTIPQVLTVMAADGTLGPKIVRTDRAMAISTSPSGGTSNLPFTPRFCWVMAGNRKVIWSEGLSQQLRVFDLKGHQLADLTTALSEPLPVTSDELAHWQRDRREMMMERNPSWYQRFGRAVESYDKALYPKPNLTRLSVTPAGSLLVEGRSMQEEQAIPYWLLDPAGELIRTFILPANGLHISANHLLFFTEDAEGLTLVHAVKRGPDEIQALDLLGDLFATAEKEVR